MSEKHSLFYFSKLPPQITGIMTEKSLLVLSVWLLSEEFDDFFSLEKISLGGIHYLLTDMAVSPPGSSVHGISQAKRLEWVAISSSRGSSSSRNPIHISCIGRRILDRRVTWEAILF